MLRFEGCGCSVASQSGCDKGCVAPTLLFCVLFQCCCVAYPRSDAHGRWLLASEALLAQSFPVKTDLSQGVAMCSFAVPDRKLPESRTARIGQAGNSMHCMNCAVAILFACLEVPVQTPKALPASLANLARRLNAQSGA